MKIFCIDIELNKILINEEDRGLFMGGRIYLADKQTLDETRNISSENNSILKNIKDITNNIDSDSFSEQIFFGDINAVNGTWYQIADISGEGKLSTAIASGDGRETVVRITLKGSQPKVLLFKGESNCAAGIIRQDNIYHPWHGGSIIPIGSGSTSASLSSRSSFPQPVGITETNAKGILPIDDYFHFKDGIKIEAKVVGGNTTLRYGMKVKVKVI